MKTKLLLAALLLAGCDSRPGLGEQCRFGCESYYASCRPEERECQDGLICAERNDLCIEPTAIGEPCGEQCVSGAFCASDGRCRALGRLGEPCGERCAEGLACGVDGRCVQTGVAGAPCTADEQCGNTLLCSFGETGRVTVGSCVAIEQKSGAFCTWAPSGGATSSAYWQTQASIAAMGYPVARGCGAGLSCVPESTLPTPDSASVDPALLGCTSAKTCGYRGVCRPQGAAPFEGACLYDRDCQSKHCVWVDRPHAAAARAGFAACASSFCWDGPWAGRCGPTGSWSPQGTGCRGPKVSCDPGLVCRQTDATCKADCSATCEPAHTLPAGAACGQPDCHLIDDGMGHMTCESAASTMVPIATACAYGLRCDGATSPPTCAP